MAQHAGQVDPDEHFDTGIKDYGKAANRETCCRQPKDYQSEYDPD
jgi:hypothetical protein